MLTSTTRSFMMSSWGFAILLGWMMLGCSTPERSHRGGTRTPTSAATATRVGPSPMQPYEAWRVERPTGPNLDVFIAKKDNETRPLVVFLQGSKCLPAFLLGERNGRRREVSTILFHDAFAGELARADFAIIERRGLKSFGPLPQSEEEAMEWSKCTPEHGGVSKDERVQDVVDVVDAFRKLPWVGPVFVVGHSEGAYVASGAARRLTGRALAGIGLLSGPGPTQFFDFLVDARRQGDEKAVKRIFDDLLWLTGPDAHGDYGGANVERQVSYGIRSTDIDDLRDVDLPIFVVSSDADRKAPIESADLFVAEMLRNPKRRIRYVMLSGLDHGYHGEAQDDDRAPAVLAAFLDWASSPREDRSVFVGLPPR